jgi:hypothetical protein
MGETGVILEIDHIARLDVGDLRKKAEPGYDHVMILRRCDTGQGQQTRQQNEFQFQQHFSSSTNRPHPVFAMLWYARIVAQIGQPDKSLAKS